MENTYYLLLFDIYILLLLFIIIATAHNFTSISDFFETVTYLKELFKKVKYYNIGVADNSKYF